MRAYKVTKENNSFWRFEKDVRIVKKKFLSYDSKPYTYYHVNLVL